MRGRIGIVGRRMVGIAQGGDPVNSPDTRVRSIMVFLALLYVFRLILNGFLPLAPDEAHYWYWSQNLQLGYFDHPPMVAWVMAPFTWLGGDTEFFVRIGGLLCMVAGQWLLFLAVRRLCGNGSQVAWEVLFVLNLTLLFAAGALVQTPDSPLILCWMLALYAGSRVVTGGRAGWWYLVGAALGFGLLSKYTMILLVPCVFGFLLFSRRHRHWLLRKEPYLALLLGLVLFAPVIVWNWQHDWISFRFQMAHGFAADEKPVIFRLAEYVGSQMGVITPLLFAAFAYYGLWGAWKGLRENIDEYLYLAMMSWPILLFFGASTVKGGVAAANWPAPAYAAGLALMWLVYRRHFSGRRGHRWFMASAIGLALLMHAAVYLHVVTPVYPLGPKQDVTKQFRGWVELGETINAYIDAHPSDAGYFLVADRNITSAAEAVFYTGRGMVGIDFFTPEQFTFIDVEKLRGKDAIILLNQHSDEQVARVAIHFEAVEEIGENRHVFNGHELPRMHLRMLRGRSFLGNWHPGTAGGRLSATGGS